MATLTKLGIPTILGQAFDAAVDAVNADTGVISTGATASSSTPVMDGVGAAGIATTYAHGDHVHPSDTTRAVDTAVIHKTGAEEITGIKTFDAMPVLPIPGPYANDSAAATGGVAIGNLYFITTTGVVVVRMA